MIRILTCLVCSFLIAMPVMGQRGRDFDKNDRGNRNNQPPSKHQGGQHQVQTKSHSGHADRSPSKGNVKEKMPEKEDRASRTGVKPASESTRMTKRSPDETQQANLDKLKSDLGGLKAGSEVTPEQVSKLKTDLLAMCDNANKPSQESVQQLSQHLSTAVSDKSLSDKEKAQLARDLQAVMTSMNLDKSEVQAVKTDMQNILNASNIDKADVQLIMTDVQAIITELQKNKKQ
ncbi:MAG: hypothetical protein U0796_11965 [Gemmatales bacterium]